MFLKGVIEGFYGKTWSWQLRQSWVKLLARESTQGCYIYAPKSERYLAHNWRDEWPLAQWKNLLDFSAYCAEQGIRFGVGFSARDISLGSADLNMLRAKLKQLMTLQPAIFCLLCDDALPISNTAKSQSVLVETCLEVLDRDTRLIFCPTWYSLDPRLRELYGTPPENYYEDLGAYLPDSVDIFWTGERVCSARHDMKHWRTMHECLRRKPILWDNSLANDGETIHQYLRMRPFATEWCNIQDWAGGIVLNPMNQAHVAQIMYTHLMGCLASELEQPATLASNDTAEMEALWRDALAHVRPSQLRDYVQADRQLFCELGTANMDTSARIVKAQQYRRLGAPLATDIADWLEGAYAFDPECVT